MPSSKAQRRALEVVGWLTAAAGAAQVAVPNLTLQRLAPEPDRLSSHLFATVGMFMTVSGGYLLAAIALPESRSKRLLWWCAAQKVGAAAAVGVGVKRRLLSPLALVVAVFDLASGALVLVYRRRLD